MATRRKKAGETDGTLLSPQAKALALEKLQEENKASLDDQLRMSLNTLESVVGGRAALVEALAVSKNPAALKFISAVSSPRNGGIPLYDILQRIKSTPDELIKIFTEGKLVRSHVETFVKLSDALPNVMDVAVESAMVPGSDGFQDRKLLFEIGGMRKPESGGGTTINLNQIAFGSEGVFEKVVSKEHSAISRNPFELDAEAEEVES